MGCDAGTYLYDVIMISFHYPHMYMHTCTHAHMHTHTYTTHTHTHTQYGHTPAHRAAALGCPVSISALLQHGADFKALDNSGHSALEIAKLLNNTRCHRIATREESPHPLPPPLREREGTTCSTLFA